MTEQIRRVGDIASAVPDQMWGDPGGAVVVAARGPAPAASKLAALRRGELRRPYRDGVERQVG